MSIEQDTGNEQKLPLAERARRGLLASEPELSVTEISELEHPTDSAARKGFHAALCVECDFGSLTAEKKLYHDYHEPLVIESVPGIHAEFYSVLDEAFSDSPRRSRAPTDWSTPPVWVVSRESYRAWRAQCPATLLSALSKIGKWLGATPVPESLPVESLPEPIPPVESLPVESLPESPKGSIALVEAENSALVALRKALKREPDFEEFWDYLTTKDETGTVADCTADRLDWIGKSEKACSTSKRTIRNRLTAAKKRNPFTPS